MELSPYLFFDGNCAEAFHFYEKVLGGKLEALMKAGDAPPNDGPQMPPDTIMHACLKVGDMMLMGSDDPISYAKPRGVHVSIAVESVDEARRLYDALSEGGHAGVPFAATFWSPGFGMLTDKFGIPWMVNTHTKA
ncbi:MAG: VOC family protein [Acidobacteria bacterium]|nr:VOC family protein [Acidobacteriota bacterium]